MTHNLKFQLICWKTDSLSDTKLLREQIQKLFKIFHSNIPDNIDPIGYTKYDDSIKSTYYLGAKVENFREDKLEELKKNGAARIDINLDVTEPITRADNTDIICDYLDHRLIPKIPKSLDRIPFGILEIYYKIGKDKYCDISIVREHPVIEKRDAEYVVE